MQAIWPGLVEIKMYLKTAHKTKFEHSEVDVLEREKLRAHGRDPTLYFAASHRPWKSYESYICVRALIVFKFTIFFFQCETNVKQNFLLKNEIFPYQNVF